MNYYGGDVSYYPDGACVYVAVAAESCGYVYDNDAASSSGLAHAGVSAGGPLRDGSYSGCLV